MEEAASRRREADARGFAARVRALRARYFSSGCEDEDAGSDAGDPRRAPDPKPSGASETSPSRSGSRAVRARLDASGLVEAMLDFKRRQSEAAPAGSCSSARADAESRIELGKLEECVLVTLSGDAMAAASAQGARRGRRAAQSVAAPALAMSDEDVLDLLNL